MNEIIFKYDISISDSIDLQIPKDSEILCVQVQNGIPCMWVKVNPENEKENVSFIIYGTGHDIDTKTAKEYIGTFQLLGGKFVGHLFKLIK